MAKFALIIAIPQYDNFNPLPKTTQDGETIAQHLHTYGDYQITRLPAKGNPNTADYEMKAGKVTVDQLYDTLKLFLTEIAKEQAALIYFTGHGFTVCDRLGREKGYLATSNCQVKVKDDRIVEQNNGFPLKRLDSLIQEANLSELVVLLDCCHSGNFIETRLMRDSLKTFEYKQNKGDLGGSNLTQEGTAEKVPLNKGETGEKVPLNKLCFINIFLNKKFDKRKKMCVLVQELRL